MYEIISTLTKIGNSLETGLFDFNVNEQNEKVNKNKNRFLHLNKFILA